MDRRAGAVPGRERDTGPDATYNAAYDAGNDAVTVTYREGEPLGADRLLVGVFPWGADVDRDAWSEAYDPVDLDDSVTVTVDDDANPGQVVVMFDGSALLARIGLSGADESEWVTPFVASVSPVVRVVTALPVVRRRCQSTRPYTAWSRPEALASCPPWRDGDRGVGVVHGR